MKYQNTWKTWQTNGGPQIWLVYIICLLQLVSATWRGLFGWNGRATNWAKWQGNKLGKMAGQQTGQNGRETKLTRMAGQKISSKRALSLRSKQKNCLTIRPLWIFVSFAKSDHTDLPKSSFVVVFISQISHK